MSWLVIDVGCIECGEDTEIVGVYATREASEAAQHERVDGDGDTYFADGQHRVDVFELPPANAERIDELGRAVVWARSRRTPHPLTADALHRYALDRTAWLQGQGRAVERQEA